MEFFLTLEGFTKKPGEIFKSDRIVFLSDTEALVFDEIGTFCPIHIYLKDGKIYLKCNGEEIGESKCKKNQ